MTSTTTNFEEKRRALVDKNVMYGQRPAPIRPKPSINRTAEARDLRDTQTSRDTTISQSGVGFKAEERDASHLDRIEKLRQLRISKAASKIPTPTTTDSPNLRTVHPSITAIDKIKERITIDPTSLKPNSSPTRPPQNGGRKEKIPGDSIGYSGVVIEEDEDTSSHNKLGGAHHTQAYSFSPIITHKTLSLATTSRPKGHNKRRLPTLDKRLGGGKGSSSATQSMAPDTLFELPKSLFPDEAGDVVAPSGGIKPGPKPKAQHHGNQSALFRELGTKIGAVPESKKAQATTPSRKDEILLSEDLESSPKSKKSTLPTNAGPQLKLSPKLLAQGQSKLKHHANLNRNNNNHNSIVLDEATAKVQQNFCTVREMSSHFGKLKRNLDGTYCPPQVLQDILMSPLLKRAQEGGLNELTVNELSPSESSPPLSPFEISFIDD